MSDHRVEYHQTWAAFFALFIVIGGVLLVRAGVLTHASHVADLKYTDEQIIACIQSDRPAADCRLIVHGSK